MTGDRFRTASAAYWTALLGVFALVCGILGIQLGVIEPIVGFYLFLVGALLDGAIATLLGLVALFMARGKPPGTGRRHARLGSLIGIGLLSSVVAGSLPGNGLPPINDITTNVDDPPLFASQADVPEYAGEDMNYPAEFAPLVREAYSDLTSISTPLPPAKAYDRALASVRALGWSLLYENRPEGRLDASEATKIFRFVDDVTIRVRPKGNGSQVDLRSRSREGRGDLGANADRIRRFAAQFRS